MQKTTYGQNDSDKIQTFKEKLHGENETTDYPARDNVLIEIGKIVVMENEAKDVMKNTDQSIKNNSYFGEEETPHDVSTMNLSDAYISEKFGHELLQFIASGHSLENWQQGNYHDAAIPSFPAQIQIENVPTGPAQQCVNADIQKANQSTLTLTVLNSTPTDDSTQPVSFSFGQSSTLVDHDYCMYSTSEYSRADNYHKAVDNRGFMRVEQHEPGMDHQKLMRMKRRKEKNRECSRQFRLKQKNKEENLKNGKTEKLRILESLRRNVENLKTTLSNVAAQCCSECPKTRMLLQQHVLGDKENINPDFMKITK